MSYVDLVIDERMVATLTMNRPDVHNAFDDRMIGELRAALAQIRIHGEVRALVLRSEGKNFSAGADLNWMRSMASKNYDENVADAGELGALMWELDQLPVPTIAVVQGAAFGGAVGLVACCDLAVATPNASFCLSEVKIGLIPAVISPYVVRAMGSRAARRYATTAERFFAATAAHWGLLSEVSESPDVVVAQWLETLLKSSPAAMSAAKKLVHDVSHSPLDEALIGETARRIAEIRVSAEGQEGLTAFLDKRTPAWHAETTDSSKPPTDGKNG
ncbi:MAG: enoyl-CoA hydratase/isomerase family protein [Idiomarina sp.]|nr:enoyl-CoA hydratase/isomerase family protein [Idiomarina sp.]